MSFHHHHASHARVIRPSEGSGRRKSPKTRVLEASGARCHGGGRRLGAGARGQEPWRWETALPLSFNSAISKSGISGAPLKTLSDWISDGRENRDVECCSKNRVLLRKPMVGDRAGPSNARRAMRGCGFRRVAQKEARMARCAQNRAVGFRVQTLFLDVVRKAPLG